MDEYPPYTPMPSLRHELGLMFGFLSLFVVAMGAYIALWRGELSNFFSYISISPKFTPPIPLRHDQIIIKPTLFYSPNNQPPVSQTRLHAQDLARRKAYRDKTPSQPPLGTTTSVTAGLAQSPKDADPNAAVQEKMLDRIGIPENRAELPVHGMEMYANGKWNARTQLIRCPFSRGTPLSPVTPASPLGSGVAGAVGSVSPVGGGIVLESFVGVALDGRSFGQKLSDDGFRSASPARRFGGKSGPPVEIGPAPSRE
ncbi:hypothetical protein N7517_011350 [Penicillium concentricum]|uniref:Uncharacterized protein n=1 Tax=Penicillium concentricum TaxID=293559 RepID=A0A9W9UVY2_9EURO|nr:uncharacterized protein N7517_011350 [Penicillium concentricum]KAJ5356741.1 hypothetical protein N7517_011350 [Penicillium concentricum]